MISKDYYSAFKLPAYTMFDTKMSPEIMGQFDPMNFVVRIDSQLSDALKAEGKSQILFTERGDSLADAFASYFHEIIHWWQHIGTTAGLFSGMAIPVQTHVNYEHLRKAVIDGTGLRKPLVHQALSNPHNPPNLNIIVNNWMDIEFSYGLLNYPEKTAASIVNDPFFESLGHALEVYFYSTVNVLATSFDRDFAGLPDIGKWDREFKRLKKNKFPMWYYGSETTIPPLGMHSILEGQARFQELQYRHISSKAKLSWSDFKQAGLMGKDYLRAFQIFLEITGLSFPKDPMSETVNIFLLLCDIALNPNSGYPDDIHDYESFINDVSPSIRFIRGANIVRTQPSLLTELIWPDRHVYERVTQAICHPLNWKTPRETSEAIVRISERMQGIKQLKKETVDWQYAANNMPIRFLYARHLSFMQDKAQAPEYFCWPVIYFSDIGNSSTISKKALMERHLPPFLAGSMDGEVKTNLPHCDDTAKEIRLIATYFLWQSIYDITRQWIARPGPFSFKYPWKNIRDDELQTILDNFKLTYGCNLDSISPYSHNLPEEVIVRPVLSAGFYLILDDIQKQCGTQNGFLKLMDILIQAVAKAKYSTKLTVWGAYIPTWQGVSYGIFITPQKDTQFYSKILKGVEKFVEFKEPTSRTEMPDNAIPLLTWHYPDTIVRYWQHDFEIPNFYEQVNRIPRDKKLYFTFYGNTVEPKLKQKIGESVLQIVNTFYRFTI